MVEGYPAEILGTTCGFVGFLPWFGRPIIRADVGMHQQIETLTGRIDSPPRRVLSYRQLASSSPPVAAARRDDLAVIAERLDKLSALVLELSKEVESIRRSSGVDAKPRNQEQASSVLILEAWPVSKSQLKQ